MGDDLVEGIDLQICRYFVVFIFLPKFISRQIIDVTEIGVRPFTEQSVKK